MSSTSAFGFGLTGLIRVGQRVEISRRHLRQKSAKRSLTYFSWTTASAQTDAAKDTPPTPAPPVGEEDDIAQRVYHLPTPSQKGLPDDYKRNDDNDNNNGKEQKLAQRILHPRPILLPLRQIIVLRGINTHPSLPERRFPMTMNETTAVTKR